MVMQKPAAAIFTPFSKRLVTRGAGLLLWRLAAVIAVLAASQSAHALEKLKVGYNIWVGSAAVFVAQEQGLFTQAGLEVELVPFKGPGDTMPPLIGGHLDIALTTADNVVLMNARSDARLKIIYATDTSNGADAVIAGKTVSGMADLKGKSVAVTQGEVNELLLQKGLAAAGMSMSDIRGLNMDPDSAGAAFIAGSVDAAVTWEPWISQTVSNGGKVLYSSADTPNLILGVVTVTPAIIDTRATALSAFLDAIDTAARRLDSAPETAIPSAAKWLEVAPAQVKDMLAGVNVYDRAENQKLFGEGAAAGTLDSLSTFFMTSGAIPKALASDTTIDARFLKE